MHKLHGCQQPEASVHPRHAGQRLSDDERRLGRTVRRPGQPPADVAAPAAVQRFRLVSEVAQDRIVPATAAFDPADQLEEETPLVLDHGRGHRGFATAFE